MAKGEPVQFDLDDEDVKLFTEEADEQLELLDTSLVQLEGATDPDLVQQIFRAAHTLKGSSATIGHKRMAGLTHAMESVLDVVRQGGLAPTSFVVDRLLVALDSIRILADEVRTRVDSGVEILSIETELRAIAAGEIQVEVAVTAVVSAVNSGLSAEETRATMELLEEHRGIFRVVIALQSDSPLPGIRCYQALQELDGLGTVTMTRPDRSIIEAGSGEFTFEAVLATLAGEDAIQAGLATVSDIETLRVEALTAESLSAPRETAGTPAGGAARPLLQVVERDLATDAPAAPPKKAAASVRIDVERLDGLMNLVGELVIDRTRLQQIREHLAPFLKTANLAELTQNFEETTAHLARVTDDLQDEIMRSRMLPVRSVLTRLPRLVRDVASKCGKKVELITAGEETELDRSVIEEISDPLVHILRNAVDHGIETPEERLAAGKSEVGTVSVTAWNQEAYIYLSVSDDGKGIDCDALRRKAVERGLVSREAAETASDDAVLQYIFFPGLSTAKTLSDVSGRGVGMDIVRTNIERLNGMVTVRSEVGKGSTFIIQLPLTLATSQALMVVANDTVYAMPLVSVTEALSEEDADLHTIGGRKTLRLRGKLLPVLDLAEALGDYSPNSHSGPRFVIAARHSDREVGLLVDRLLGEQDVVVKSLGDIIGNRRGLTGATILGDGTLGLIVDTASLVADPTSLAQIA